MKQTKANIPMTDSEEGWILGACQKDLTVKETITLLSYVNDNF